MQEYLTTDQIFLGSSSLSWFKWNTDAPKIVGMNLTSIGLVCKDNMSRALFTLGEKIVEILVAAAIRIHEALRIAAARSMKNIVVEAIP